MANFIIPAAPVVYVMADFRTYWRGKSFACGVQVRAELGMHEFDPDFLACNSLSLHPRPRQWSGACALLCTAAAKCIAVHQRNPDTNSPCRLGSAPPATHCTAHPCPGLFFDAVYFRKASSPPFIHPELGQKILCSSGPLADKPLQ